MWSFCLYTTARVPSLISKSFRSHRGITTCPFTVNDTVSVFGVGFIMTGITLVIQVSQIDFCDKSIGKVNLAQQNRKSSDFRVTRGLVKSHCRGPLRSAEVASQ